MEALRRELRNLARKNTENDSMVDYYRDLSALSNKLYETQSIHDTVMEDPMGLFNPVGDDEIGEGHGRDEIEKVKRSLADSITVVSSARTRLAGETRIEAEMCLENVGSFQFLFTRQEVKVAARGLGVNEDSNSNSDADSADDADDDVGGKVSD